MSSISKKNKRNLLLQYLNVIFYLFGFKHIHTSMYDSPFLWIYDLSRIGN